MSTLTSKAALPFLAFRKTIFVLCALACVSSSAYAANFVWDGDKSDSLKEKKNWVGNTIVDNNVSTTLQFGDVASGRYAIEVKSDFILGGMTFDSTQDYSFFGSKQFEFEEGGFITNNGSGLVTFGAGIEVDENTNTWGGSGDILVTAGIADKAASSASLEKVGAGTLFLNVDSSAVTWSNIDLNAGITHLGAANALGSFTGRSIFFDGGTLQHSASNTTDYSSRFKTDANQQYRIDTNGQSITFNSGLSSTGSTLYKLGSGTLTLNSYGNQFTTANVEAGTLAFGNSYILSSSPDINIRNGSTLNIGSTQQNIGVLTLEDGIVTGSGLLRTDGIEAQSGTIAGDLAASGANFNKTTSGTVILDAEIDFQTNTNISGGTLEYGSNADLDDNTTVNITNGAILNIAGVDDTVGDVNLTSGSIIGTDGSLKARQFTVESGTITANLDGYSYTNLTKTSSGTVILSGENTYTNNTVVNQGTLLLAADNVFADASDIEMNGGTLDIAGFSDTIHTIRLNSGLIAGTGTLTTSTLTLNQGTIEANLAGSAALTKNTGGTVTLSGNNTFSGGSTLNGGTVRLGADNALGTGTVLINSGTFDLNDFDQTTGALSGFGSVDLGSGRLTVNSASNSTFGGSISGTGALTKNGSGTLTLSGSSTFSGGTDVQSGTLRLGQNNALFSSGDMQVESTLDLNNYNQQVSALNGSGNITLGSGTLTAASGSFSGSISGSGDLVKSGPGTLSLTGSNSHSGDTEVQSGTLRLANVSQNNTTIQSSSIHISGGTLLLDDSHQISNSTKIVLSGGTLKLGGSGSASETLGTLTLSASSTIDFGGADWTLAFADSSGEAWNSGAILTIVNWSGTAIDGGGPDQLRFGNSDTGLTSQQLSQIRFANFPGNEVDQLAGGEVVPVPEPKFYVGGGALLALVVWFERRRRKSVARSQ